MLADVRVDIVDGGDIEGELPRRERFAHPRRAPQLSTRSLEAFALTVTYPRVHDTVTVMPQGLMLYAMMIDNILAPRAPGPPSTLFHYTDHTGFLGLVSTGEMWATDIRCMNDTRELQHGLDVIRELVEQSSEQEWLQPILNDANFRVASVFGSSLTSAGDLLSQWRAYGEDGRGYVIEIKTEQMNELKLEENPQGPSSASMITVLDAKLCRVVYDPIDQRERANQLVQLAAQAKETIRHSQAATQELFARAFASLAAVCKIRAFEEEDEWRLIFRLPHIADGGSRRLPPKTSFRVGRYGLTPFVKLPIGKSSFTQIIRGPKQPDDTQGEEIIRGLLFNSGVANWDSIGISHANASYR